MVTGIVDISQVNIIKFTKKLLELQVVEDQKRKREQERE